MQAPRAFKGRMILKMAVLQHLDVFEGRYDTQRESDLSPVILEDENSCGAEQNANRSTNETEASTSRSASFATQQEPYRPKKTKRMITIHKHLAWKKEKSTYSNVFLDH